MGEKIQTTDGAPAVTLSLCSERRPEWSTLVTVPVSTSGKIAAPIARALNSSGQQQELDAVRRDDLLFSVKRDYDGHTAVTTYLPLKDVHFKTGRAAPADPGELARNISLLAGKLRMIIDGTYPCIRWDETRPAVHVVGHTDTVGSDRFNQRLSARRARTMARALQKELRDHQEVQVCYAGVGESQTRTADNIDSAEARRAEVMVSSEGPPFSTQWTCLKAGRRRP